MLVVPLATNAGLVVPVQALTPMISGNCPVATRTVTESVLKQRVVGFVTVTKYLLLSTSGVTEGADAVVDVLGPVQAYVQAALGCVFKVIELFKHTIGLGGKVTLGNGLTLIVVEMDDGQSPILAETSIVVVPLPGVMVKNVLSSPAALSIPFTFHFQPVTPAFGVVTVNNTALVGSHKLVSRGARTSVGIGLTLILTVSTTVHAPLVAVRLYVRVVSALITML